jgi:hypothetical protein
MFQHAVDRRNADATRRPLHHAQTHVVSSEN